MGIYFPIVFDGVTTIDTSNMNESSQREGARSLFMAFQEDQLCRIDKVFALKNNNCACAQ